jgi:hypothetical protein
MELLWASSVVVDIQAIPGIKPHRAKYTQSCKYSWEKSGQDGGLSHAW